MLQSEYAYNVVFKAASLSTKNKSLKNNKRERMMRLYYVVATVKSILKNMERRMEHKTSTKCFMILNQKTFIAMNV